MIYWQALAAILGLLIYLVLLVAWASRRDASE